MTLALTVNNIPPATNVLSPKEATTAYASFLSSESVCVDVSSYPVKLLHSRSNRNKSSDSIRLGFPAWATKHNIRVNTSDYPAFLRGLADRVMSQLPQILGSSFRPVDRPFFTCITGVELANTYVPFRPARPDAPIPEILEEYFVRLFESQQDRQYVLQFLADIIQNPARRPMWSLLITGDHGTGKSTLFTLVKLALGGRHCWEKNDYRPAFKQFSEVFPDNLLVSFDDAPSGRDVYQDMKQCITRTSSQVEIKGEQKLVYREEYARIVTFSNHIRPFVIEPGCRRLYVTERITHKSPLNPEGCVENTKAFFVGFKDWWESKEAPAILYHFFMDMDLSDFKPGSTIQTETHAEMVGLSSSVLDGQLSDFIKDDYRFHQNELLAHLKGNGISNPNLDSIRLKLNSMGYIHARRKVVGSDKQQDVWQKKVARSPSLTDEEEKRISAYIVTPVRVFGND
jgi:hypothetical protein